MCCDDCKRTLMTIMVEMEPGRDGKPWWLCKRCWKEGLPPKEKAA